MGSAPIRKQESVDELDLGAAPQLASVIRIAGASDKKTPEPSTPRIILQIPLAVARLIYKIIYALLRGLWITVRAVFRYIYNHPFHAVLNSIMLTVLILMIVTGSE